MLVTFRKSTNDRERIRCSLRICKNWAAQHADIDLHEKSRTSWTSRTSRTSRTSWSWWWQEMPVRCPTLSRPSMQRKPSTEQLTWGGQEDHGGAKIWLDQIISVAFSLWLGFRAPLFLKKTTPLKTRSNTWFGSEGVLKICSQICHLIN